MKFYICKHCGNIIAMVQESGVPVICCGEAMEELVPGTTDGAGEKHLPIYEVKGDTVYVRVGSVTHPMMPAHFIQWIALETEQGNQRKELRPGDKPEACFKICEGDKVTAVYEYCNVHKLWKTKHPTVGCECGEEEDGRKNGDDPEKDAGEKETGKEEPESPPKKPGEKGYGHGYGDEGYDLWKKSDMK